jgi:hypothetical protein
MSVLMVELYFAGVFDSLYSLYHFWLFGFLFDTAAEASTNINYQRNQFNTAICLMKAG